MAHPPGSDVCKNGKSSYSDTDLFIKRLTEQFLKHETSTNVILPLDEHRSYCSSLLLLQTAVENNVTIICLPIHCSHILQPLDK